MSEEEYELKWIKNLDEMEDLPLYDCFKYWIEVNGEKIFISDDELLTADDLSEEERKKMMEIDKKYPDKKSLENLK